jgi:hypothetical protein
MADLPTHPDTEDASDRTATSGTPRWAVIAGIAVVVALVVVMIALHVTGVIGPGSH